MKITAKEFLEAKFGHVKELAFLVIPLREGDEQRCGDLIDLLQEFKMFVKAKDVVMIKNPRSEKYTAIDKGEGCIIGAFEEPIENILL